MCLCNILLGDFSFCCLSFCSKSHIHNPSMNVLQELFPSHLLYVLILYFFLSVFSKWICCNSNQPWLSPLRTSTKMKVGLLKVLLPDFITIKSKLYSLLIMSLSLCFYSISRRFDALLCFRLWSSYGWCAQL